MECDLNNRGRQKMFREDVNLAVVDPYDWSRFPEIIYPLKPLDPSLSKDLIWKWDKLVSLITDPFQPARVT